jgi:hypothetical protein
MRKKWRLLHYIGAVLSLVLCHVVGATNVAIQPFVSGSYAQIDARYGNDHALVLLWSVDCPPCLQELDALSKEPHLPYKVVLISTDPAAARAEVRAVVEKYAVGQWEHWQFASAEVERLRFEVDPRWYGETPRSYVYRTGQERLTLRGALTQSQWLALRTLD